MIAPRSRVRGLLLAALAAVPAWASAADDLGRLFTTPQEREQIDEAREGAAPKLAPVQDVATPQQVAPADAADSLTLRGVVDRGTGRSTAWVNDSNTYQGDAGAAHRHVERTGIDGARALVTLPNGRAPVQMKVGQTYDPAGGRIRDLAEEPPPATAAAPEANDDAEGE